MKNEPSIMTVETITLKAKDGKYQWRKQREEPESPYSPVFDTEKEARDWMTAKCGNSCVVRTVTKFL